MDKVIFMGRTGSGKTTLCQKLNELELKYRKTQAIEIYDNAIDTPGEYLENRNYYRALIMTAVDAKLIALVADPTAYANYLPPAFAGIFAKEVIGIITKISLVTQEEKIILLKRELLEAGVQRIFLIDTIQGIGLGELYDYLTQTLSLTDMSANADTTINER